MKTKTLNSCPVIALLICVFVFAYANSRLSHDAAYCIQDHLARKSYKLLLFGEARGESISRLALRAVNAFHAKQTSFVYVFKMFLYCIELVCNPYSFNFS